MTNTNKLLHVSSVEYDKAEALTFLHAVVAPVAIMGVLSVIDGILTAMIATAIYVLFFTIMHTARLYFTNDKFGEYKSRLYFEYLLNIIIIVVTVAAFATAAIYGVYHV